MHSEQRGHATEFHHIITVGHGIHGVVGNHRGVVRVHKAQLTCDKLAVQRERGARQRAAAQRANVHAHEAIEQPLVIAFQHFHVSQQMMCEINRLCALQMRVAGDEHFEIIFSELDERQLQVVNFIGEIANFLAQPHPGIQRDLIVA